MSARLLRHTIVGLVNRPKWVQIICHPIQRKSELSDTSCIFSRGTISMTRRVPEPCCASSPLSQESAKFWSAVSECVGCITRREPPGSGTASRPFNRVHGRQRWSVYLKTFAGSVLVKLTSYRHRNSNRSRHPSSAEVRLPPG